MTYKREQYNEISGRINEPRNKMQVIVGPRQVGKTTLINQVIQDIDFPNAIYSADDVIHASADWISEIWEAQRMSMAAHGETKRLLVIDEIQKISNWSETVKAEWDKDTREKRNLSVVILGSSRMLIEKGLTESMAGRFELIRLPHWSYREMHECFGWSLQQYVYFGGYPGASMFINDSNRWRRYVKDSLIETSISKDALLNTKILKPQLLRQLFEIGSTNSAELLSLTKVAGQLQDKGNVTTLAAYLQLLDDCGLLAGLQKYSNNTLRTYKSIPKFQVYNNALRNVYANEKYEEILENPKIWGRYVESAVGAYLLSQSAIKDFKLYYWRERDYEVDFVISRMGRLIGIEVKSGRRQMNAGLPEFKRLFSPYKTIVVGSGGIPFEEFFEMDLDTLFT